MQIQREQYLPFQSFEREWYWLNISFQGHIASSDVYIASTNLGRANLSVHSIVKICWTWQTVYSTVDIPGICGWKDGAKISGASRSSSFDCVFNSLVRHSTARSARSSLFSNHLLFDFSTVVLVDLWIAFNAVVCFVEVRLLRQFSRYFELLFTC